MIFFADADMSVLIDECGLEPSTLAAWEFCPLEGDINQFLESERVRALLQRQTSVGLLTAWQARARSRQSPPYVV